MRQFSVYEAKAKLSEILRLAQLGTNIVITYRGKAIAEVRGILDSKKDSLEDRLTKFLERGFAISAGHEGKYKFGALVRKPGALARFLEARE